MGAAGEHRVILIMENINFNRGDRFSVLYILSFLSRQNKPNTIICTTHRHYI